MSCSCLTLFSRKRFFYLVISLTSYLILYGFLSSLLNAQELDPSIQERESPQKGQDQNVPNQPSNPRNDSRFEPFQEQEAKLNPPPARRSIPKSTPKWKSPQDDVKTPKNYPSPSDPLDSFEKEKTKEIPLAPRLPKQKFENKAKSPSPKRKKPSRSPVQVISKTKEKKKPNNNLKQVNSPRSSARYKNQKKSTRPERQNASEALKEKKPTSPLPYKVEKESNPKIPNKNAGGLIERLPNFEMSFLPGYNKLASSRLTTLPHQTESYAPETTEPKNESVQSSQSREAQEQDFFQDLHERFTDSGGGERTLLNISLLTALIAVFAVFRLRRRRRKGY